MNKVNIKSIKSDLRILAILAFGLIFIPLNTTIAAYGSNIGGDNYNAVEINNPIPSVTSINPNNGNREAVAKIATITGNNFALNSIARVNGSNRTTTFIDYSHLLIQLTASDMNRTEGFFITVFNGPPGGGYSNGIFFTIKNIAPTVTTSNTTTTITTNNSTNGDSSTNGTSNTSTDTSANTSTNTTSNTATDSKYSNLASNVIFGTNSFMPSGLIQWILLAIIILIIVILARRVFGLKEEYNEIPMKHV